MAGTGMAPPGSHVFGKLTLGGLPWAQIAGMHDRLAYRYFDTSHAIFAATVSEDLPELDTAVRRLLQRVGDDT